MSARGTQGLSCKRSAGRSTRHHQVNDLIWRALQCRDVLATKEISSLLRDDGKRPMALRVFHSRTVSVSHWMPRWWTH